MSADPMGAREGLRVIATFVDSRLRLIAALGLVIATVPGLGAQSARSPVPLFRDFPIREAFRGTPAVPVLATAEARRFSTELSRQAAGGPNFAGFYTFARWGCGAGCVTGAIIDVRTGQVWFPKFRVEDFIDASGKVAVHHGSSFELDSELVIAEGVINEQGAGTAYFRWHTGTLELIRFDRFQ